MRDKDRKVLAEAYISIYEADDRQRAGRPSGDIDSSQRDIYSRPKKGKQPKDFQDIQSGDTVVTAFDKDWEVVAKGSINQMVKRYLTLQKKMDKNWKKTGKIFEPADQGFVNTFVGSHGINDSDVMSTVIDTQQGKQDGLLVRKLGYEWGDQQRWIYDVVEYSPMRTRNNLGNYHGVVYE